MLLIVVHLKKTHISRVAGAMRVHKIILLLASSHVEYVVRCSLRSIMYLMMIIVKMGERARSLTPSYEGIILIVLADLANFYSSLINLLVKSL